MLASAHAVSDSPSWDQAWLRVLLDLLPDPPPTIRDLAWLEQQHQLSRAGRALLHALWESAGRVHRARSDAEDLARAWQRVLAYEAEPRRS